MFGVMIQVIPVVEAQRGRAAGTLPHKSPAAQQIGGGGIGVFSYPVVPISRPGLRLKKESRSIAISLSMIIS